MAVLRSEGAAFAPSIAPKDKDDPHEQELFEKFADEIVAQQREDASGGKPLRGFHAKIHAGLIGEFRVLDDLPDYARQGVFSTPRTFPAVVRFSNGESTIKEDTNPEPRGIAIKLIGVGGRKVLPDHQHAVTQDFLATSHSVTSSVRNAEQFFAFVRAHRHSGKAGTFFKLVLALGPFEAIRISRSLKRTVLDSRVRSMATEEFSGTAPIQFGPYAVKFTVRPASGTVTAAGRALSKDFLHDELAERLRAGDLMFDFLVQFYVDDHNTPIEDTSVPWQPVHAPFLKVAQLRIPRGELDATLTGIVNGLSFSPWHALEDHRPLGSVMRARRVAYVKSAALRQHSPEPTGLPLAG